MLIPVQALCSSTPIKPGGPAKWNPWFLTNILITVCPWGYSHRLDSGQRYWVNRIGTLSLAFVVTHQRTSCLHLLPSQKLCGRGKCDREEMDLRGTCIWFPSLAEISSQWGISKTRLRAEYQRVRGRRTQSVWWEMGGGVRTARDTTMDPGELRRGRDLLYCGSHLFKTACWTNVHTD